jgi:hypothetical protein
MFEISAAQQNQGVKISLYCYFTELPLSRTAAFCLIFFHTTLHFVANGTVLSDAKKYDTMTKIYVNH